MGRLRFSILNLVFLTTSISLVLGWSLDNWSKRRTIEYVSHSNAALERILSNERQENTKLKVRCDSLMKAISQAEGNDQAQANDIANKIIMNPASLYKDTIADLERTGKLYVEPTKNDPAHP